jgi:hypothetical protein
MQTSEEPKLKDTLQISSPEMAQMMYAHINKLINKQKTQ